MRGSKVVTCFSPVCLSLCDLQVRLGLVSAVSLKPPTSVFDTAAAAGPRRLQLERAGAAAAHSDADSTSSSRHRESDDGTKSKGLFSGLEKVSAAALPVLLSLCSPFSVSQPFMSDPVLHDPPNCPPSEPLTQLGGDLMKTVGMAPVGATPLQSTFPTDDCRHAHVCCRLTKSSCSVADIRGNGSPWTSESASPGLFLMAPNSAVSRDRDARLRLLP